MGKGEWMRAKEKERLLRKLDVELRHYRRAGMEEDPTNGLLRAVRMALQMPVKEIAAKMAEADPLAEISLGFDCPICRHTSQEVLDLGSFLWTEIEARARQFLSHGELRPANAPALPAIA